MGVYLVSNDTETAFRPTKTWNKILNLGATNAKWNNIYGENFHGTVAATTTSDKNAKDNIKSLINNYDNFFMKLQPVSFTLKEGTSGRTHIGFIAQDVEQAMEESKISFFDFAGICKDNNEQYTYSLRYDEFIALNTHMIQKTIKELNETKKELAELKAKIKEIKGE